MLIIVAAVIGGLLLAGIIAVYLVRRLLFVAFAVRPMVAVPAGSVGTPVLTTIETVVIGAGLGVLAAFVHSFGLGAPYPALLEALIAIAAAYGVNVITGPAFANLLNVPQGLLVVISLGLGTVQVTAPFWGLGTTGASIVQGVVAFVLALGFGTAVSPAAAARSQARAVKVNG